MTIQEIYNLAIKLGIEADPRSKIGVAKILKREREDFQELKKDQQAEFDQEYLTNPYPDSRILYGDINKKVKRILVGIDIGGEELFLADRFNSKGKKIDLVISHHPLGKALAKLDDQVKMQADTLCIAGVPIHLAETHIEERVEELTRNILPLNHFRSIDTAKILNLSLMCTHTIADNLLHQFIQNLFKKEKPELLSDLIKIIKTIPEYQEAILRGQGPIITAGKSTRHCGKILIDLTGGTNGSKNIYEGICKAGINTIVAMYMPEIHKEEAQKHHLNIVILGHMPSDSLGMNLFLDELEKQNIEVIPCSGLIRIKRIKK